MIPRDVLQDVADATVELWYTAAGMRVEYAREIDDLDFRDECSCGFIDFSAEARS